MNARLQAERLRLFTEQSNAVHEQYLSDPVLLQKYEYFLDWQVDYSLPFYSEFQEKPETAAAVEFVISDLIGTGVSARDADLTRVIPVMVRLLPGKALHALASAMELNARALAINLDICRRLFDDVDVPSPVSEREYCAAFRQSTSLVECLELIQLTINLGHSLKRLVRSSFLGMTLRAMHRPAHAAGFGAMQDFLEKGYTTFHAIEDVDYFLERFAETMTQVFTRTCEEPLENMDSSTRVFPFGK
ncbi:MAG: hypothetical protein OEV34_16050 [Gammaproteobacteria bacterium]|nr:hypothetical protein [Gammaproteobacteria bacterium]MDH3990646.1 hypothetical protein [Gammaproteobacteria bacterium]